jgi:cell division septum initiation protein DivIVA
MSKFKRKKHSELVLEAPEVATEPATVRTTDTRAEPAPDFGHLGTHVGTILGAAEEAAARIQQEARVDAEHIRGKAKEWARRTRSEAESFAADTRAQAEANAADVVARAERQAVAARQDGERRQQALQLDISHAEKRLRDLVTALHGLADRLNSVLSAPTASEDSSESLEEALATAARADDLKG